MPIADLRVYIYVKDCHMMFRATRRGASNGLELPPDRNLVVGRPDMTKRSYLVFAAALLAASMWIWVLRGPIAHQPAEAAELGVPRGYFSDLYPRWLGARELLRMAATRTGQTSALEWRPSLAARLTWIILVLGSFPAIHGFALQQLTLLVSAFVAAAMYAITRRYFVWAGIRSSSHC
jgi:hypothetical protein